MSAFRRRCNENKSINTVNLRLISGELSFSSYIKCTLGQYSFDLYFTNTNRVYETSIANIKEIKGIHNTVEVYAKYDCYVNGIFYNKNDKIISTFITGPTAELNIDIKFNFNLLSFKKKYEFDYHANNITMYIKENNILIGTYTILKGGSITYQIGEIRLIEVGAAANYFNIDLTNTFNDGNNTIISFNPRTVDKNIIINMI